MSVPFRGKAVRSILMGMAMAVCAAGALQAFHVTPAYAAVRRAVCADTLYVRSAPAGATIGTLFRNETISVESYSPSGDWAYGLAYGHVNTHGWVQNGWFCN